MGTTADTRGDAWWFLGTLVVAHRVAEPGGITILEQTLPVGAAPPLHRHLDLDDDWYLLEGTLAVREGDQQFVATAGSFVHTPMGVSHQFRVVGDRPARILMIHASDRFYDLVRALGEPARTRDLPVTSAGPSPAQLTATVEAHHQQVLGPSMSEDEAAALIEQPGCVRPTAR